MTRSLAIAAVSVLFLAGAAFAGPVILGGDDLTDHGSRSGTANLLGWLYIERAVGNILNTPGNITRAGNNGSIAVLGAAAVAGCPPTCPGSDAGAAIGSVADVLGKTVNYYEGAAAINQFFADLQSGAVNPAMLWLAGTGASNNLDSTEGAALTSNATNIANFVASGGGLMAHGSGPDAYGWLATLIPGIVESSTCNVPATLTAAGMAAFPGLTNADISAGPCHNTFSGNLGSLQVLATESGGLNFILGGGAGTVIGGGPTSPIPTLSEWMLALFAILLASTAIFLFHKRG
ncbi:MAG: IPTL-CTERM sorting domain-containing protein [Thermoanaerobaculia bacterium]